MAKRKKVIKFPTDEQSRILALMNMWQALPRFAQLHVKSALDYALGLMNGTAWENVPHDEKRENIMAISVVAELLGFKDEEVFSDDDETDS